MAEEGKLSAKASQDKPPAQHNDDDELKWFDAHELIEWSFYRSVIVEFIATLLFLYITVLTVIGYKSQIDLAGPSAGVGPLGIAWAFGGMIFLLVYCTTGIAGEHGHINPAVTFGILLARRVTLNRAVVYMVAQCLGAICGVGLVKAFQKSNYDHYGGGVNELSPGYSKGAGLGVEIMGTFVLVYTVFHGYYAPVLKPLAVGFAVLMVHLATIPITGSGINPARSFGAAVIYNKTKAWDDQWIFWVGPFIGAAIAALYYRFIIREGAVKAHGSSRSKPRV